MKIYAVDLVAFAAISVCIASFSGARGANTTEGGVSSGDRLRVDDHNGVPVYGLPKTGNTTIAEERGTKPHVSDEVIAAVGNMLLHFTPKVWLNTDATYRMTPSNRQMLNEHAQKLVGHRMRGDAALRNIVQLASNPRGSQTTLESWILSIRRKTNKNKLKKYRDNADKWLKAGTTPQQVYKLLEMDKKTSFLASRHLDAMKDYIEQYNRQKHDAATYTVLETLLDCADKEVIASNSPAWNEGKRAMDDLSMEAALSKEVALPEKTALSKKNVWLAIRLSMEKLSVLTMEDALKLQEQLLNSWSEAGVSIDDVFQALMNVAMKQYFFLFKYLDTFVEYVKLLNAKRLPKNQTPTDVFAYLRQHFDNQYIAAQLERARQESIYHQAFIKRLLGSGKSTA